MYTFLKNTNAIYLLCCPANDPQLIRINNFANLENESYVCPFEFLRLQILLGRALFLEVGVKVIAKTRIAKRHL